MVSSSIIAAERGRRDTAGWSARSRKSVVLLWWAEKRRPRNKLFRGEGEGSREGTSAEATPRICSCFGPIKLLLSTASQDPDPHPPNAFVHLEKTPTDAFLRRSRYSRPRNKEPAMKKGGKLGRYILRGRRRRESHHHLQGQTRTGRRSISRTALVGHAALHLLVGSARILTLMVHTSRRQHTALDLMAWVETYKA